MDLQILYADTLFLSNFVMNLLALSLTGMILHVKCKKIRLFISSLLGGAYSLSAVLFSFPGWLHITVGILLSCLLVLISFGDQGRGTVFFLRIFLFFYFTSVLLGGGIEALFSLLEGAFGMRTDLVFRPADAVLVIGFFAFFIFKGILGLLSGGGLPHSTDIRVVYGERSVTLSLLVDSGCTLADPISGRGAILVSADALRNVFPPSVLEAARERKVTIPKEHALAGRCRLLPMRGVGEEKLLLAFRPKEVTLVADGGSLDVWVAICHEKSARFGGFGGLCPTAILTGRVISKKSVK